MSGKEKHANEVARKLLAGANVHEIVGRSLCDDDAAMYHFDMANVMREAAAMLQAKGAKE